MSARKKGTGRKKGRRKALRKRAGVPAKKAIDQFAKIQQESLRRYQDYAEFALREIRDGNFQPRDWVNKTTDLWTGMLDDLAKAMKVYL